MVRLLMCFETRFINTYLEVLDSYILYEMELLAIKARMEDDDGELG